MKKTEPPSAEEFCTLARRAASHGDYHEALAGLSHALDMDSACRPAYRLAAECLTHENRADLAKLIEQAHQSFQSAPRFYDIGYRLVEDELYHAAIPFLIRALDLDPYHVDAATELSVAFTATGRVLEARRVLEGFELDGHFWAAFQLQWVLLLTDDLVGIEEFIALHRRELADDRGHQPSIDSTTQQRCFDCLTELEECLKRRQFMSSAPHTLRDWHFIQYGAALLACPWPGEGLEVGGGRFTEFWPDLATVRTLLERFLRYLDRLALRPQRVIAMPGHDALVLATALGQLLNLEVAAADRDNCEQPDVLIVAAHHSELASHALVRVRRGQTLFAGNIDWTHAALICPDVAGFVSERLYYPWDGGTNVDSVKLGRQLAATLPVPDPDADTVLDYYKKLEPQLKGHANGGLRRLAFMTDTPVLPPEERHVADDLAALLR